MNKAYISFFAIISYFIFSSFSGNLECEYAKSTITIVKTNTEKAIEKDDINQVRYYAYKSINAMEKSKKQLKLCGCTNANEDLDEGLDNLILATKATRLSTARELLLKALDHTLEGLNALTYHRLHKNNKDKYIAMENTANANTALALPISSNKNNIKNSINNSLEKYRLSLDKVIKTVECKEAYSFTKNIVEVCDKQLLKNNLSEGKKYYYLRTKDLTTKAMSQIGDCKDD